MNSDFAPPNSLQSLITPDVSDSEHDIRLSIILRCRNEADSLRRVLTVLHAQHCNFKWELIIVDNESHDDTQSVAHECGARVVSIRADEYSPGRALNRGIATARGEFCLLLSAHSLPLGVHFLDSITAPFNDERVAFVQAINIQEKKLVQNWHEVLRLECAAPDPNDPRGYALYMESKMLGINNACATIRRSVWKAIPFAESLEAVEDKAWVIKAAQAGHVIERAGNAFFYYLREYSQSEQRTRALRFAIAVHRMTGRIHVGRKAFALNTLAALGQAPLEVLRTLHHNLLLNWLLFRVPAHARRPHQSGVEPEYEKKQTG